MNKRALVVDDSDMIRDVFSQQLIFCGFDARSCDSLDETLDIIQNWQPDVVFLDLRMPGHDGFEVIKQIRAKFSDPPKVIAVTGSDDSRVRQQAKSAGFERFLLKPFRMAQLMAILENLLS